MSSLSIPSDAEVRASITNIAIWLQSHSQECPNEKAQEVFAEDLAIAVPGECLFPELGPENEEASREEEKGILVYTDDRDEKYIWLNIAWYPLEKVLHIRAPKSGWVRTINLGERLLMLILTQLDYAAKESEAEVPYGCCPLSDPAYLLWHNNHPLGMCSLKTKGSSIWGGEETYACDTLDTLYVRPSARRQGHTIALLRMLAAQLPSGEHLGLSHPVSLSMCKVLLKFIHVCPELRDKLWTLDEDGEVSGTIILMLSSLMVRGALPNPALIQQNAPPQNEGRNVVVGPFSTNEGLNVSNEGVPARSVASGSFNNKYQGDDEEQQMITDKMQQAKVSVSPSNTKFSTAKTVQQQEQLTEVDEPCDTS